MEQIRCENPNIKQRKKKKERKKEKTKKQTSSPRVENPSPWVSIDQIRCENPNIKQRKKRKNKRKTKEKKIRSKLHHQSLIRCKRCEIPCYYQQIRYITSSNVKNTFGFLWKSWERGRGDWFGWHVKHCVNVTRRRGLAELGPVK